jgi:hypothetical protein
MTGCDRATKGRLLFSDYLRVRLASVYLAVDVFAGWEWEADAALAGVDVGARGERFGGVGGLFEVGEVTGFVWELNPRVGAMDEGPKFQTDGGVVWRAGIESFGDEVRFDVSAGAGSWRRGGRATTWPTGVEREG